MKEISIKSLKQTLSAVLREAAEGTSFVVTSHNRPVAELRGTSPAYLHCGEQFGKGKLKPLFRSKTRGKYLEVLTDVRQERSDVRAKS